MREWKETGGNEGGEEVVDVRRRDQTGQCAELAKDIQDALHGAGTIISELVSIFGRRRGCRKCDTGCRGDRLLSLNDLGLTLVRH